MNTLPGFIVSFFSQFHNTDRNCNLLFRRPLCVAFIHRYIIHSTVCINLFEESDTNNLSF